MPCLLLHYLILAVCDEVPAVPSRVYVGDAVDVAGEQPDGPGVVLPERAPVPDLAHAVIAARRQDVRVAVHERDRVHVVVVGVDLNDETL